MVSKVDGIEIPVITKLEDVDKVKNDVKNLANNIKSAMNNLQKELGNITLTLSHIYRSKKPETQLKWINQLANKDIPNLIQKIKGIGNSADKATKDLGKFGNEGTKSVSKLSNSFKDLALRMRSLTYYYAGSFLIRSVTDMIASLSSLQASFANIQAITASSNTQMTKLQKTIFDVASSTRYTTEEISEATTILGQAGLSVEQIQGTLMQTAVLASATGTSVAETANNMTSVLAVWNMTADQTSRIADTFVTAINGSKATMQTMSQAIQYAGVQLADMGVSFEEVTAAAAGTANAGMKVRSMIGTGMRSLVTELQAPTKKVIDGLEKYGLTVEDVSIETYGLIGVMKKLKEAGIDGSNAFDFLNKRSATFLVAASSQLDAMDSLRKAFADEGAAARANETQMNTLNAQMVVFKQTIQKILYEGFEPFINALTSSLKSVNSLIGAFSKLGSAGLGLITIIGSLSFGNVAKSIKVATKAIGMFGAQVNLLTKAMIVLRYATSGWVGVIAGVVTVLYGINKYLKETFDWMKSLDEKIEKSNGELQENNEKLLSVKDSLDELYKKQKLYSEDQNSLNLRIIELNKQFSKQGLQLIKLGSDWDTVTEAIRKNNLELMKQRDVKLDTNIALKKENLGSRDALTFFSLHYDPSKRDEYAENKAINEFEKMAYQRITLANTLGKNQEETIEDLYNEANTMNFVDSKGSLISGDKLKEFRNKLLSAINNAVEVTNLELEKQTNDMQIAVAESGEGKKIEIEVRGFEEVGKNLADELFNNVKIDKHTSDDIKRTLDTKKTEALNVFEERAKSLYNVMGENQDKLLEELRKAYVEGNDKQILEVWKKIRATKLDDTPEGKKLIEGFLKLIGIIDAEAAKIIDVKIDEVKAAIKKAKESGNERFAKSLEKTLNDLEIQKQEQQNKDWSKIKVPDNNGNNPPVRERRDPFLTNMKSRVSLIEGEGKIYKARSEGERLRLEDEKASETRLHFHDEISKYADQINELNALTQKEAELRALLNSQYGEIIKKYQEAGTADEKQAILRDLENRGDLGRNALDAINLANSLGADVTEGQQRWGATPEEREDSTHQLLNDAAFASQMDEWAEPEANAFKNIFSGIMGSDGMQKLDNQIKSYTKSWTNLFTDLGKQIGDSMQTGMTDAANAIWSGEKSVGEAFGDMGKQILNSLGQFVTQLLVQAAVISALNIIPGMTAALEAMDEMAYVKKMTQYAGIASAFSALGGATTEDVTSKKANGGLIGGGVPNRDSVHAMLMPGEYVMKKSAVDALGTNFLSDLNNNAEQTMDNAYEKMDEAKEERKPNDTSIEPSVTNVWVVADRDQAKMGPQDVIATISRDILTGGQTKRLIQSVVAGRK